MANVAKNAILRAKIANIMTDIMVKTTAAQVFIDESTTLEAKLATLAATADVQALQEAYNALGALAKKDKVAYADLEEALAALIDGKAEASALTQEIERAIAAEGVNAQAAADALAEAKKKVASVSAADASVTVGGTAAAPTIAAKLSAAEGNALELADDGLKVIIPAAAEYTIEKASESGEYAAVYALKKDGVQVGASINIPKDMVVESGSVVENPEGQVAGTYIKLVLQNVEEPLYINVGSLIEYVTSGSAAGDMVVVAVSEDHKVTATITDGTITLAKLSSDVQTAIGKAHDHANKDVLDGITVDKVSAWDDVVGKVDTGDKNVSVYVADAIANKADKATTLAGYGITDAYTSTQVDTKIADAVKSATGGESAASVKSALEAYQTENNTRVGNLETRVGTAEGKITILERDTHAHSNLTVLNGIDANVVADWNSKGHIYYSETEPAGMTENDLWFALV